MQKILISSFLLQDISISYKLNDWKDFYNNFILPKLSKEQLNDEYLHAKTINTALKTYENGYQFVHNLTLNVLLSDVSNYSFIHQDDSIKIVSLTACEELDFSANLIFETLDMICRNSKSFDNLSDIYDELELLISPLAWKEIYPNSKFTKTCFYNLINVKMRTAQNRQQKFEKNK